MNMNFYKTLIVTRYPSLIIVRHHWRPKLKRTPYTKPIIFNSGDLSDKIKTYNPTDLAPSFENVNELKNANEKIKKLFSLEYQTKDKTLDKEMNDVIKLVQEHPADLQSIEVQIARLTVLIRRGMKHCHIYRHDGYSRKSQEFRIKQRSQLLGQLKLLDQEKFNWLTNLLKLQYKDPPLSEAEKADAALDRSKRGLRRLAAKTFAQETIEKKTKMLEEKLRAEREKFEVEKLAQIKEIEDEMIELGIISDSDEKPKLRNLREALKLLGHEHLIPEQKPELPEWKIIHQKKMEIFMPKKKIEDDRILRANGFLTEEDFPKYPDTDFY